MLAQMGYVAFCADVYGKGVRASTNEEAGKLAGSYKADRPLLRRRVEAALKVLKENGRVDPKRVAAIGYCFGGTAVLELARSGADLSGVVSFHGGLGTEEGETDAPIRAKVLVLTGADDRSVPPSAVASFEEEMRKAGADYQVISYGGAVHGFSNPDHGDDPSKGVAYNASADGRSWEAMKVFFAEILGR
jgi:dienelactone hydrolase